MIRLTAPRARRRLSLTPMIDVVFLLLVFFMLVARFGAEGGVRLDLAGAGGDAAYSGPPRLIDVLPDALRLNGAPRDLAGVVADLPRLMDDPLDIIVLRPRSGASVQRLLDVSEGLAQAGFARVVVVP